MKVKPVKFFKSLYYANVNTTTAPGNLRVRGFSEGYYMKPTFMETMKAGKKENKYIGFLKKLFKSHN